MANGSTLDQWNVMPDWLRALLGPMGPREAVPGLEQAKRGFPGPMPKAPSGPSDPLAALGLLDPSQQQAPGPELPIGPRRQSAVTGMMPGLGEMPALQRDSGPPFLRGAPLPGGMDDTRFRGPTGQMAPEVDLGGAALPVSRGSPGGRTEPLAASAPAEMDPDRRIALLGAARNLAKAGSQFANITGPAGIELEAQGRRRRDFSIDTSGVDAEEERIRRGDFENPNSPASIGARQMLSQATGQEVPETMSAAVIMALNPMFDRLIRAQYAGQSRAFQQGMGMLREQRAQEGSERAQRAQDRLEVKEKRPTPQQAAEFGQINTTIRALENLLAEKPEHNTGPIIDLFENALTFIGGSEFPMYDLSEKNAFKASINDMLAQYMKSISGVAISELEARRLQKAFPKSSDDDKTFVSKARAAIGRLQERRAEFLDTLESTGKDVSALRGGSPEGGPAPMPRLPRDRGAAGKGPAATGQGGAGRWIKGSDGKKYPYDARLQPGMEFDGDDGPVTVVEIGGA